MCCGKYLSQCSHLTKMVLHLTQKTAADEKGDFKKKSRKWTWNSTFGRTVVWDFNGLIFCFSQEKALWKRLDSSFFCGWIALEEAVWRQQPEALSYSSLEQLWPGSFLAAGPWLTKRVWRKWTFRNKWSSWLNGLCHICWYQQHIYCLDSGRCLTSAVDF